MTYLEILCQNPLERMSRITKIFLFYFFRTGVYFEFDTGLITIAHNTSCESLFCGSKSLVWQ